MKSNKIMSVILSIAIIFTASGCAKKEKKQEPNQETSISYADSSLAQDEVRIQTRMIDFIEKIEQSELGLDLTNFYENAKTLRIVVQDIGAAKYASYNIDDNEIILNKGNDEGFEHELIHVILADRKKGLSGLIDQDNVGVALNEGLTEIITNEFLENDKATYFFDTGITKILTIILGKEIFIKALNEHNNKLITEEIAKIKPAVSDAHEYLIHWDYAHFLLNEMHEEYFTTGSIENFKLTSEYKSLQDNRFDLTSRLKIYVKEYYSKRISNSDIDPFVELTNMIAILNIFNEYLYSPDIEINQANDFFLKDEVQYLVSYYKISSEQYQNCVNNATSLNFFRESKPEAKVYKP